MKMETAARGNRANGVDLLGSTSGLTSRLLAAGLLFLWLGAVDAVAQPPIVQIQRDFDNGLFEIVAESVKKLVTKGHGGRASLDAALLAARSLIVLERFDEARLFLDKALTIAEETKASKSHLVANIYLEYSALERSRREFRPAIEFAKKARLAAPNDARVESGYYFSVGRILYSLGYDQSAVVWLEKAERSIGPKGDVALAIDIYRYLSLASSSRFQYAKAIASYKRMIELSERHGFRYKHRQALFELGNILNASGQKRKGSQLLETALKLSISASNVYQARLVLTSLLLNALYDEAIEPAAGYIKLLEQADPKNAFAFEVTLGRAVIAALKGHTVEADRHFGELAKLKGYSLHAVPYWKATIAERNKDWKEVLGQNTVLRKLAEENNFRDDLPGVYLGLAKAHLGRGEIDKATEFTKRTISMVEEARKFSDTSLSFGVLEIYHTAYRLLSQLCAADPQASFELADFVKARVLKDRIDDSFMRARPEIPTERRKRIEDLSLRFVDNNESADELEKLEKKSANEDPTSNPLEVFAEELKEVKDLTGTAIVSYLFTMEGDLLAYVWTKDRPVRIVKLPVSEIEADLLARATVGKIKNLVFFKKDGKGLYDLLLAPLSIDAEHVIIIPDKSLWRIPFHALSPDGSSYLIERKLISYAPSVTTLLNSLEKPAPSRKTIKVFANNLFRDRFLRYADREARNIAGIFGLKPSLNATAGEFIRTSGHSDILHFAMHAELDAEEPLDSFLAFRPAAKHDGRITVDDLLKVRLKPKSLVFLASCDTSNVLNGEGLVSIAWAMMGSGATSVISSQWEANDKSTEMFTDHFYNSYRRRGSLAESIQSAAIAMIRNKSAGSHEPYFWAAFALHGDFR